MMKENFFDRKAYLAILEKRINGLKLGYRQNIAFLGDELIGKTSLIAHFLSKFYDNQIIVIYSQLRPESLAFFAKRFIGALLYNFLSYSDIPLKEDLDFLISKASKYIPATVGKIRVILADLEKRKKNNIFPELLSLCETVYLESGKFCVVILDEFQHLENMRIKNLYRDWSKQLILQKHTLYIVISSLKFKVKAILSKQLSLLFGNFEIVEVEPFDIRTSEDYLKLKLSATSLNSGWRDFIVQFSGGYPFYLEVIADALLKISQPDLVDILESLLFIPSGILHQRFSNYLKRFLDSAYSQDYIALLYLISTGHNKLKDLSHILRKPRKELALRLNRLLELDTITRSGDFLKINDRVFAFWLKFVYQGKIHALTYDAKNQKALFRENIEKEIREFIESAKKPVAERMMELLRLFEDEMMLIEGKRLRLSHFKEIKHLEFAGRLLKNGLLGRSADALWIMGFKQDLLTEDDVAEFTKECRKYRHKTQKKIIVSLKDIDSNARLKAMEEKIITWDISSLNQMFELFSKPGIVV